MKIDKHNKQFGKLAKDYTKYRTPYTNKVFNELFSLNKNKNTSILDVACGTGKSTEPLIRKGVKVFGCDHDPEMIKEAIFQSKKKKLYIDYKVANVEKLPYKNESFDIVTVGTAFHWFVNKKSMNEIKRVLKSNGLIFVYWTLVTKELEDRDKTPIDFLRSFKWDKVPQHLRDLGYISEFFKKNNLEKVGTIRIPFTFKQTVSERVGLMKTASSFGVLSKKEQDRFVAGLTKIYKERLGKRKHFVFTEEIQVCYGFKK